MHNDPKLLAAYRNGETWAYEQLYKELSGPVTRFLQTGFTFVSQGRTCRYRGNMPGIDADGIVQESFARAFAPRTRQNYDGERPFKNYLFSIAKNLVLREFQRRERVLSVDTTDEATEALAHRSPALTLLPSEASPEGTVADGQLTEVTAAFIAELSEEEQRFFQVRFVQEMTQEASAKAMGVTRARVKLLEKNLRRRFLERLRGHGYFVGYTPKPRWKREQERAAS